MALRRIGEFLEYSRTCVSNNSNITLLRLAAILIYYMIGIAFYHSVEGWSRSNSAYFITVSVTVSFPVSPRLNSLVSPITIISMLLLLLLKYKWISRKTVGYGFLHPVIQLFHYFSPFSSGLTRLLSQL